MGKVRWDPVADQLLFTKLLETHDISIDFAKIADAWPVPDDDTKPTPRAIRERVCKIKELTRATAAAGTTSSSPVTPKKRTPRKKSNDTPTPGSPSRKRKRLAKTAVNVTTHVNSEDEADQVANDPERLIKIETIDPQLQSHPQAGTTQVNNQRDDADWSPEQDEGSTADSTSEHRG